MRLIVGLGNPGQQYDGTRHNVGFSFVDFLCARFNLTRCQEKYSGLLYKAPAFFLFKPLTFMNLSGNAIFALVNFFKIAAEDILIVYDDLDLPLGKIRIQNKGSHGGHNGLRDILAKISPSFWRLRIGIGRPMHKEDVSSYVLSSFTKDERTVITHLFDAIENNFSLLLERRMDAIMSKVMQK